MYINDFIFALILFFNMFGYAVVSSSMEKKVFSNKMSHSTYTHILHLARGGLFLEMNIINIIFSIFPLRVHICIILQIFFSLILFVSFVKDYFIENERRRQYISLLQNVSGTLKPLSELFDLKEENTSFEETKSKISYKIHEITLNEVVSFSYKKSKNSFIVFIPRSDFTASERKYYIEMMNIMLRRNVEVLSLLKENILTFSDKTIYENSKYIVYENESYILSWIKNFNERYLKKLCNSDVLFYIGMLISLSFIGLFLYYIISGKIDIIASFFEGMLDWLFTG